MTVDVPVESPQGNVLNYSATATDDEESLLDLSILDSDKIPVVVLKKLDNEDEYRIVSPSTRSSSRARKAKHFDGFELDLSAANLRKVDNECKSPKKRLRSSKTSSDKEMISPMKVQKTPSKLSNKEFFEENVDSLCNSLVNGANIVTPVKRSLNKTDFSDGELTENAPSPRKRGTPDKTPIKNTYKRTPKKFVESSPMSTDENELLVAGRRQLRTPSKFQDDITPIKSVKINLDESFRRSVLKCNLENVLKDCDTKPQYNTSGSASKQSTPRRTSTRIIPTKAATEGIRKSVRQSTAAFYYDSDSDTESEANKTQNGKIGPVRRRLKSESDNNSTDVELNGQKVEAIQSKTPSRRKQVLRPRKDSTTSNASDKSPERRPTRQSARTPRGRKDSASSNAMEVSPERQPQKETAPKTPRNRKSVAATPSTRTPRGRKNSASSNAMEESPERKPQKETAPKTPRNRKSVATTPKSVKATPKTPKNTLKLLRDGVITPSMHSRSSTIPGDSTPLMKARSQLHVSHVPTSLPCREKEHLDVYNFLRGKLEDGCGGCMYISGVPGTGKTATVTSVIDSLQNDRKVPKFSFVSLNGMRLTEPRQSYVEIWKQLTGKTVPWEQAQSLLEERFTRKKHLTPVVMLIDELDILCTKRQDVVYNLLDWPTKSKDQLIVITIANTMDLPERLLMSRVTSRLGLTRLTFQAYTHKQLMEIVTKRLTGTDSFNADAIQLVARKVASVSGDARRALDICRRAAEIAEEEGKGQLVNIMHINDALNAMITQPQVMAIKRCSRLQKLLLQAIVAEIERTGVEETTFSDVYRMLVSCCALDGFKMVSSTAAQRAVCGLSAYRLIINDQKCSHIYQRIILNVSVHDVYFALKQE